MTKNTIFWGVFWGLFVVVSIGAVFYIPYRIEKRDERVRQEQIERARREKAAAQGVVQGGDRPPSEEPAPSPEPMSDDARRIADILLLEDALAAYALSEGMYPVAASPDGGLTPLVATERPCTDLLERAHLDTCPQDPLWPERSYRYRSEDGAAFELTALLDGTFPEHCTFIEDLCIFIVTSEEGNLGEPEPSDQGIDASLYEVVRNAYN